MFYRINNIFDIPKKPLLLLLFSAPFNFLVYWGARAIASGMEHHSMATALDSQIPFLPWTAIIYWGCYIFWITNYVLCVKYDKGNGLSFIGSHYFGEAVCFLIFVLFPTIMVRPEVTSGSFWSWAVNLTYQVDAADNLFPSIHCFASWLCWVGVRGNKKIPAWYRGSSFVIAVAICVCTLTMKQHVIADVPAGIILAELSYLLSSAVDRRLCRKKAKTKAKSKAKLLITLPEK